MPEHRSANHQNDLHYTYLKELSLYIVSINSADQFCAQREEKKKPTISFKVR